MITKLKIYLVIVAGLAVAVFWIWSNASAAHTQGLVVSFFDIGQGDAALVLAPNNFQILIDGGPNNIVLSKIGSAMPSYDKTIELVVISHPDKDHISGLVEVLRRYKVKHVLATMVKHELADYEEIQNIIKEKSIPVILAQAPKRIVWDSGYMDVLYPLEIPTSSIKEVKANSTSVVNKLVFGQNSVLFTGDLEEPQELELILRGVDVKADILKVAHHGSKTSSSPKFLEATKAYRAVISAGKNNRYGHPHQEVLERLSNNGVEILRTDKGGDIVFESDGSNWWVVQGTD